MNRTRIEALSHKKSHYKIMRKKMICMNANEEFHSELLMSFSESNKRGFQRVNYAKGENERKNLIDVCQKKTFLSNWDLRTQSNGEENFRKKNFRSGLANKIENFIAKMEYGMKSSAESEFSFKNRFHSERDSNRDVCFSSDLKNSTKKSNEVMKERFPFRTEPRNCIDRREKWSNGKEKKDFYEAKKKRKRETDSVATMFLIRMEKRREERMVRRNEIRKRREEMEAEKERELRRKEKEAAERRAVGKERQKMKFQREKAKIQMKEVEERRVKSLLRRTFRRWKRLMCLRKEQGCAADGFNDRRLLKNYFNKWKEKVKQTNKQKEEFGNLLQENRLKKKCMSLWKAACLDAKKLLQAAADWNDLKITTKYFEKWKAFALEQQLRYLDLKRMADSFFEKNLKAKYFNKLKNYPKIKMVEINGAARKSQWMRKIIQIIPDYQLGFTSLE